MAPSTSLDAPPPSPALSGGTGAGTSPDVSLSQLSGKTNRSNSLPGITALAEETSKSIQALAGVIGLETPEAAKKLRAAKELVLDAVALYAQGQAEAPPGPASSSLGSQYPGGGIL